MAFRFGYVAGQIHEGHCTDAAKEKVFLTAFRLLPLLIAHTKGCIAVPHLMYKHDRNLSAMPVIESSPISIDGDSSGSAGLQFDLCTC